MESEKNMEHKIVFATSNAGKMREIREILKDLGAEILSMKEAGVDVDIVEDGDTFAANAGAGRLLRAVYGGEDFL